MSLSRHVPPQADIERIAQAAEKLRQARVLIQDAAQLYLDGACPRDPKDPSGPDPAGALGYWGAWKATTTWLDEMPGIQSCTSEWTGGSLNGPGRQAEDRWPSGWGWNEIAFGEPPMSRVGQVGWGG